MIGYTAHANFDFQVFWLLTITYCACPDHKLWFRNSRFGFNRMGSQIENLNDWLVTNDSLFHKPFLIWNFQIERSFAGNIRLTIFGTLFGRSKVAYRQNGHLESFQWKNCNIVINDFRPEVYMRFQQIRISSLQNHPVIPWPLMIVA